MAVTECKSIEAFERVVPPRVCIRASDRGLTAVVYIGQDGRDSAPCVNRPGTGTRPISVAGKIIRFLADRRRHATDERFYTPCFKGLFESEPKQSASPPTSR